MSAHEDAKAHFEDASLMLDQKDVQALLDAHARQNIPSVLIRQVFVRLGNKVFDYEKMKAKDPDVKFAEAWEGECGL